MTLAIVDDDEDVRKALARLLDAMGHEVRIFTSAEEFATARVQVDCAIVDVRLPGLSGMDLAERLRRQVPPLPVVLITGDGEWPARGGASRGADTPLLTKPFDDTTLSAAIARATSAGVPR